MLNLSKVLTTLILSCFMVDVNEPSDDYLTPAEAARTFGVSTTTLLRWVRSGKLQSITLPSGHHRYRKADLANLTAGGDAA